MAKSNSRSSKTKKSARTSGNGERRSRSSSSRFGRFGNRSAVIVLLLFVIIFGGLGTWYVVKSKAISVAVNGHDCIFRSYSYAPYDKRFCVVQLQNALQVDHAFRSGISDPGNPDGYFGRATLASVKSFQSSQLHEYPDGVVSGSFAGYYGSPGPTWRRLCNDMDSLGYLTSSDYWLTRAGYAYYGMGCNNLH
ncbi:MAG TPA: hypothetical protein VLG47_05400 [Candidatus Saccharimonadales bacterium]|nr:hypothetical protein [Candidatus Saccharimonadales bacterium]